MSSSADHSRWHSKHRHSRSCIAEALEPRYLLTAVPVTNWVVIGPSYGRSGMSVLHYNLEGTLSPEPGDVEWQDGNDLGQGMVAWQAAATNANGYINIKTLPLVAATATTDEWQGMAEYLATYITLSGTGSVTATLATPSGFNHAEGESTLWLNGNKITPGSVTLNAGVNTLIFKSVSHSNVDDGVANAYANNPWDAEVTLDPGAGRTLSFSVNAPNRKPVITTDSTPQAIRYVSYLKRTDGEQTLFSPGDALNINYSLTVGLGKASNYQDATTRLTASQQSGDQWVYTVDPLALENGLRPAQYDTVAAASYQSKAASQVRMTLYNDQLQVVGSPQTFSLTYSGGVANLSLTLNTWGGGTLAPGNYVIRSALLNPDGTVQAYDLDHSFSVLAFAPVNTANDDAPRKLGVVAHWLMASGDISSAEQKLDWLSRDGFTTQEKLVQQWTPWGISWNGTQFVMNTTTVNNMKTVLAYASSKGIDVIGDLDCGFATTSGGQGLSGINCAGLSTILYSDPHFSQYFQQYAALIVNTYKDYIHSWTGENEISAYPASMSASVAQMYTAAEKAIYAGMKSADSSAVYASASLVNLSQSQPLFNNGFIDSTAQDELDVHSHSVNNPDLFSSTIGNSSGEGVAMFYQGQFASQGIDEKDVVYGELSSPRGYSKYGASDQAAGILKQTLWALKQPEIQRLDYLAAYGDAGQTYNQGKLGFDNQAGDPLPVASVANVVNSLVDGRKLLPDLIGPDASLRSTSLRQVRVTGADGLDTLVLWSTSGNITVNLQAYSGVTQMDMYGRVTRTAAAGIYSLTVGATPVYVRGILGTEGNNLALNRPIAVDSQVDSTTGGDKAVDGSNTGYYSRWVSANTMGTHYLEVSLGASTLVNEVRFFTGTLGWNQAVSNYKIQYWTGTAWADIVNRTSNTQGAIVDEIFGPVTTSKIRLETTGGQVSLYEIEVFGRGVNGIPVLDDQFLDNTLANTVNTSENDTAWYALNSNVTGASWTTTTDNTPPLSGTAMYNQQGSATNTTMVGSLPNSVTLSEPGDGIVLSLNVRAGSVVSTGGLDLALGYDNGTPTIGNELGTPTNSGDDELIWSDYLNNSLSFQSTKAHTLTYRLTLADDGVSLNRVVILDGKTIRSDALTGLAVTTLRFNQVRIFWNSAYGRIDNVRVEQTAVLDDHFLDSSLGNGSSAGETDTAWYGLNGNAAGTAWTTTTDNTTPLSGAVLFNGQGAATNTTMVGTLPIVLGLFTSGDAIEFSADVRAGSIVSTGGLDISLGYDNGTPTVGNEFGTATNSADDVVVSSDYIDNATAFQTSATHSLVYRLTLAADGLNLDRLVTLDGTAIRSDTLTGASVTTLQFNQVRIAWNNTFGRVDNVRVKVIASVTSLGLRSNAVVANSPTPSSGSMGRPVVSSFRLDQPTNAQSLDKISPNQGHRRTTIFASHTNTDFITYFYPGSDNRVPLDSMIRKLLAGRFSQAHGRLVSGTDA